MTSIIIDYYNKNYYNDDDEKNSSKITICQQKKKRFCSVPILKMDWNETKFQTYKNDFDNLFSLGSRKTKEKRITKCVYFLKQTIRNNGY